MSVLQKLAQVNRNVEAERHAKHFGHMLRYLAMADGRWEGALKLAEQDRVLPPIRDAIRAVVDSGSTTSLSALAPYRQLSDAFVLYLRAASAFDRMLPHFRAVPMHQAIAVASGGATAATVGEGAPKPVTRLEFTSTQIVEQKTVCIVGITKEILHDQTGQTFLQELARAVAAEVDRAFIARMITGISVTTSNGGTSIAVLGDLAAALAGLALDATSQVFLVVSSDIAKAWTVKTTSTGELLFPQMTPTGGTVQGMQVLVSSGVTGMIVAIDATQIGGSADTVELDRSDQASIEMSDAPNSPPTATAIQMSAWQMNIQLMKAVRRWGAERFRSGAVSVIGSVSYTLNSPA